MISLKGNELHIKGIGHLRLEITILCIILGAFIGTKLLCNCCKFRTLGEAFTVIGSKIDDVMQTDKKARKQLFNPNETYEKVQVPLPEGQLFYYANNEFKPECCKNSSVSGTGGCACLTDEQEKFLENRGGNKTYEDKF